MAQHPPPDPGVVVGPWPPKRVPLRPVLRAGQTRHGPPRRLAVISRDPTLATTLQLEYSHLVKAWRLADPAALTGPPGQAIESVVLDVRSGQRRAYEAVRQHFDGWLIIIVNWNEKAPELPDDPRCIIIGRPFGTADLLELVVRLPPPHRPDPEGHVANEVAGGVPLVPIGQAHGNLPIPPSQNTDASGLHAAEGADLATHELRWWPRRANRRKVGVRWTLAAAATGLLAFLLWFGAGLVQAAQDVRSSAEAARSKLGRVNSTLDSSRPDQAEWHLRGAKEDLGRAQAVFRRRQVRIASHLPLLADSVENLRHFLDAARHMTRAADSAVLMYGRLGSEPRTVLRDERFNLAALSMMTDAANGMAKELAGARADLLQVDGGVLQPGVKDARASGLHELDELENRVQKLALLMQSMPSLLGADRPRSYLVVMTNPAELRPAGGVPSAAVRMLVDGGVISVRDTGMVEGDLWTDGALLDVSSEAKSSPYFPTAGEALLRAYEARTGARAEGVISVDPLAMRALLRATGPVSVSGYGLVTADNVGRLTMRDAYRRWPDERVRARYNQGLFNALLSHLLDGQQLITKARALGTEASGRHLQVYVRDATVQPLVEASVFGGTLGPGDHDYLAVFTQNTTGGDADYDQRRTVRQLVRLRPDGSADVTRTVKLSSPATGSTNAPIIAMYLPRGGTVLSVRVDGQPRRPTEGEEAGRPFVRVGVKLVQSRPVTVELRYRARQAASRTADGRLRYELVTDIQPMVQSPTLEVAVQPPPRMLIEASTGWAQGQGAEGAILTTRLARGFRTYLVVRPD